MPRPWLTASALGNRGELRIIDRGPGIPEADRDQAFLPFRRLGSAGQTVGVGLGLAVSRSLAEAMGLEEADEEYRTIERLSATALDRAYATWVQMSSLTQTEPFCGSVQPGAGLAA